MGGSARLSCPLFVMQKAGGPAMAIAGVWGRKSLHEIILCMAGRSHQMGQSTSKREAMAEESQTNGCDVVVGCKRRERAIVGFCFSRHLQVEKMEGLGMESSSSPIGQSLSLT
ncbi:hypothetical protein OPV22_034238 [Ensete ventricosum]|uniref:Uncharacterized protein n=1 Tax=Ensete ventricosum TaxID=4639 RepID=A0AAV8PRW8_ENSVE|nr:hypothetical protein OPV22_034238 [Ensete ventricosum]